MPNMYARGILFGKMVLELGDTCIAKNEKHGLYCDLEFKTKVRCSLYVLIDHSETTS
jgi:oxysterol-binding protein-related protein 8